MHYLNNSIYSSIKGFYLKNECEKQRIINKIKTDVKDGNYDFGKLEYRKVKNNRTICSYPNSYTEPVLLKDIFYVLMKMFHIRFANRDSSVSRLFDFIDTLPLSPSPSRFNDARSDFTMVRFDFKNFFYSISTSYVFEKYIRSSYLNRDILDMIKTFSEKVDYCCAGLSISNIFAEIIAADFDTEIKHRLKKYNLILYERYVDDGVIAVEKYISETEFYEIIDEAIRQVFYDPRFDAVSKPNKVKLNKKKYYYLSKRDIRTCGHSFNFLGYDFTFDDNLSFKYGITKEKIDKYSNKIEEMFKKYYLKKPIMFKYFVKCFSSRVVYKSPDSQSWVNKGIIASYKELRRHKDFLDKKTKDFLNNVFIRNAQRYRKIVKVPKYILVGKTYNLLNNLVDNRAVIFDPIIGYSYSTLENMVVALGKKPPVKKDYDRLTSLFLKEIKIGKRK